MTIFVGDDWAEDHHDIHLMDADGARVASRRLPEGLAGVRVFHELVGAHAEEPAQVIIGIETDRGLSSAPTSIPPNTPHHNVIRTSTQPDLSPGPSPPHQGQPRRRRGNPRGTATRRRPPTEGAHHAGPISVPLEFDTGR